MMAFMALGVVQVLVFRGMRPFLVLPASPGFPHPCFPGSCSNRKEEVWKEDQPEVHPNAATLWLPAIKKGWLAYSPAVGQTAREAQRPVHCIQSHSKHARLQVT